MIFGLPGESREMIVAQAEWLSRLPLHSLKIHQLQIIHNTPMAREYASSPEHFTFYQLNEYLDLVIDFLEHLSPDIIIERIAGEVPPRFLAGPGWGLIRNNQVLHLFEQRLKERSTWQGRFFTDQSRN
jgi:radical SAM superfamily enzyme